MSTVHCDAEDFQAGDSSDTNLSTTCPILLSAAPLFVIFLSCNFSLPSFLRQKDAYGSTDVRPAWAAFNLQLEMLLITQFSVFIDVKRLLVCCDLWWFCSVWSNRIELNKNPGIEASSGAGTNLKEGGTSPERKKSFSSCPSTILALKVQLVVLVIAFVMVSTVWSVSCLPFFYSQCPHAQPSVKVRGTYPPCPMESAQLEASDICIPLF